MGVILIANLSANGQVLLAGNPAHAAPPEALGFFIQKAIEKGNIVIGRKTFDVLQQFPGGASQVLPGVEIVLLSTTGAKSDHKVVDSPAKALDYLHEKGFTDVIVGGGAGTFNAFLEDGLITEVYFNTIPMIIGDGGIIGTNDLHMKFEIVEHKLLTRSIAQIHLNKI
ncbi:MAG TPA: dihydrofolate reductase [Puia sp.]|jgi:dihydrofolate reductase